MVHTLFWIEIALKGSVGLLLLLIPGIVIRTFGLPAAPNGFWPRIAGALLTGLALATLIQGSLKGVSGLGLAGSIAINIVGAVTIASILIVGGGPPARRGRVLLWALVIALVLLSLFELAHV